MANEVAKLQERLGVPKDEKFDDEDYGLGKDISDEEAENKQELQNEVTLVPPAPSIITDESSEQRSENQNNDQDPQEDFDDNYSDNFSDISHSEESRSEDSDHDTEEIPSSSPEDADGDEQSDKSSIIVKNYDKTASNSDINSDSEISEICWFNTAVKIKI